MLKTQSRNLPLNAVRAFLVLLVVAHHSVMVYLPEAPPIALSLSAAPRWWQAFPIVDPAKWSGFSLLVSFNDTFFMAALFLLSGLFVWTSLRNKGTARFLHERAWRLGGPFLLGAAVVAPTAYYATYRQISGLHPGSGFWHEWLRLGVWPAGPAWFLWVLLTFDLLATGVFVLCPHFVESVGNRLARKPRPILLFVAVSAVSTLAFTPLALHLGSMSWFSFGPFSVQQSRILLYFVYFLVGTVIGAGDIEISMFNRGSKLSRQWPLWLSASVLAFGIMVIGAIAAMQQPAATTGWGILVASAFCLSCAASTFAILATFARFVSGAGSVWANLQGSSFGIYLLHYAFVAWLQYGLLSWRASALAKGCVVFLGALFLSWTTVWIWRWLMALRMAYKPSSGS